MTNKICNVIEPQKFRNGNKSISEMLRTESIAMHDMKFRNNKNYNVPERQQLLLNNKICNTPELQKLSINDFQLQRLLKNPSGKLFRSL